MLPFFLFFYFALAIEKALGIRTSDHPTRFNMALVMQEFCSLLAGSKHRTAAKIRRSLEYIKVVER
jgi:hypothetical protein